MVFLTVEMQGKVALQPNDLPRAGLLLQKKVILRLLDDIARKKISKEHGYYVALKTMEIMGEGLVNYQTGEAVYPVSYTCITFMPFEGEILIGTIDRVMKLGIQLKSEPIKSIFLSEKTMDDYKYSVHDEPMYVHVNQQSKMVEGTKVRFRVMGVQWMEAEREFRMLGTIAGDFLGPVI